MIGRVTRHIMKQALRYGKTGNKKGATCFATLLQMKLDSNVAGFTTQEKNLQPYLMQRQVQMWVVICEHRYSNCFAALLQNKLHVFC